MLAEVEILNPIEVRVLGALLEKDMTTPEYYPMTVNSLQNACNQKSSREPVTNFGAQDIEQALELLQNKGLVMRFSGAGHRVEKFGHRLGEKLNFGRRRVGAVMRINVARTRKPSANCVGAPNACTISRIWRRSSTFWERSLIERNRWWLRRLAADGCICSAVLSQMCRNRFRLACNWSRIRSKSASRRLKASSRRSKNSSEVC